MLDNHSLTWENYKTGVKNSYKPDIKFKDAFNTKNSFGEFVAQEIATQIPIFTTMIGSGGLAGLAGRGVLGQTIAASTSIGITSGGQQYNTMTAEEMVNPFLDYSEAEKFLVSSGLRYLITVVAPGVCPIEPMIIGFCLSGSI